MPRPRSSTFYLPLAPADAPLSLKAKLSVLPPSAANALLAPRSHPASAPAAIASTHTPVPPLDSTNPLAAPPKEDECARLERVLGLCNSSLSSTPGARRTARRHTDAPLPSFHPSSGVNPFSLALTEQPADPRPTSSIQSLPSTSLGISAPAPAASSALGPDGTSTSPRIGASDMDAFASACAFGSADITPVTQASDQTETSTTLSAPATTSTSRPASATAPSRPVTAERRRLSMVPCGLPKIWACRTLYPSKLCSSVSADDDEESTTEQRRTILPHQLVLPPSIASCGSLHPLDARHLLPRHFRMSFPPPPPPCPAAATATAATNPAPESCAPCTDGINTSLTTAGLARTTTISTHSPADETALSPGGESGGDVATCVQMECDGTSDRVMQKALSLQLDESPVRITLTPPGPSSAQPPLAAASASTQSTPPPRQRYRLAPLYLHKVLRRSLGVTAWARAETVRLARAVEQAYGVALVSQAHVISSSTSTSSSAIGRHTQWEDIVRSGYHLPPVDTTPTSSLVWSGYEDVYIPGEGDQTNTSAGAAFSGQLSAGGANVWIQNVFDSAECAWDIDLEDEDEDDMEMDFDNEDFEAESDTTSSSHFVRESAPEPEERRPVVVLEPTSPHTPVENSHESRSPASNVGVGLGLAVIPKPELEDTRSPSPDGYGGYAAVGKFTWGSEWPSSPTTTIGGARPPTGIARQWSVSDGDKLSTSWRMDEDGPPATPPYHPALSPSTYSSSSSASTSSSGLLAPFSHEEEENIFRYSPLQEEHVGYSHLPEEEEEDDEPVFRYSATHPDDEMEVDLDVPQGPHAPDHYIYEERSLLGAASPCTDTIPISLSPSFPPPPLIGTKISSCGESEDESDLGTTAATAAAQEEREDEFYDVPSPSAAGVFIIPPSPLTKTSFGQPSPLATTSFGYSSPTVVGPSTPTSTSRFAHQQQQPPLVDDQAPRRSLERIRSSRRSMERIGPAKRSMEWIKPTGRNEYASSSSAHEPSSPTLVAPRPRRASRALENVFSRQSPVFKTSALPNSPPTSSTLLLSPPSSALLLPTSPPSSSLHLPTSPPPLSASSPPLSPLMKAGVAAWTFGSLKSALSNSVSQLVELARSRSPSPLPWLIRGGSGIAASSANAHATTTTLTLAGAASALASASSNQATPSATPLARHLEEAHESSSTLHTREPSSEELEAERASCVTPTPTSSRPRRASSTTITKVDAVAAVVSVPQVQLETTAGEVVVGTSPPPKRTLSTSSLSSLESEPESESGSSGGVFSRSPSPEPDSRTWDASSLTPRSRPISADAKGAVSNSGRLSPMMIPGSWDPNELLWDDEDVANDQLRI